MESNVQKMREALNVVIDALATISAHEDDIEFVRTCVDMCEKTIKESISAPQRNCDRFEDLKVAQRYYIEHGCPKGLGMLVDGEIRKFPWKSQFEKWLFANAKEGGSDGSK